MLKTTKDTKDGPSDYHCSFTRDQRSECLISKHEMLKTTKDTNPPQHKPTNTHPHPPTECLVSKHEMLKTTKDTKDGPVTC
ncbi:hypothetical protein J6590_070224 [Homalodisca vitripennis]|nr:hypothetical protein J6590_070224 [Homalodisca vitripennis]